MSSVHPTGRRAEKASVHSPETVAGSTKMQRVCGKYAGNMHPK